MQVFSDSDIVPAETHGSVVALGNFDGVHRGHQAVLGRAKAIAAKIDAKAGALTFDPHPQLYFRPTTTMFTVSPLPRKLALLDAFGMDFTGVLTFNQALAGLTAEAFVEQVLVNRLRARHVVVGYNFFFGKGRGGSPHSLERFGAERGFEVTIIEPESDEGDVFSSSSVRDLLRAGNVREAAEALGHWWAVSGVVEHGAHLGTGMGYPTVNVMLEAGQALHHGIYAARVHAGGKRYDGAAYNGRRPTFDNGIAKLEVFLFDFSGDLYGSDITVELIDFIRPDEAFTTAEALVKQMDADCAAARDILAGVKASDPMMRFPIGRKLATLYEG